MTTADRRATAELQVLALTADPAVAHTFWCDAKGGGLCFVPCCKCWCHKQQLDRHADALATLAGFVRRAFIGRAR